MEEALLEERARAKADPKSASRDTNPDFYSDYGSTASCLMTNGKAIRKSDARFTCRPRLALQVLLTKAAWRSTGYLEVISSAPTVIKPSACCMTEVEQVQLKELWLHLES